MTRQVRLDADVVALVQASNPDGLSLSGATNRLLRQLDAASRIGPRSRPVPPGGQPARPKAGGAAARPAGTVARRAKRFGRCAHPSDRAVGNRCGVCGGPLS